MADSFDSSAAEAFHGFGGRHNALDQHGQSFYNWVIGEHRTGRSGGRGRNRAEPGRTEAAYYVQSSFVSNQGYGFLLDRSELSRWRLDSVRPDAWQTSVAAPAIDYVVAPGSMTEAIATLTAITGRQRVPPAWTLGPMFDQEGELGETAGEYEHEFSSDLRRIKTSGMPVAAYRLENWQSLSRPVLEGGIAQLQARGIHPLVYFRPFVGQTTLARKNPRRSPKRSRTATWPRPGAASLHFDEAPRPATSSTSPIPRPRNGGGAASTGARTRRRRVHARLRRAGTAGDALQ